MLTFTSQCNGITILGVTRPQMFFDKFWNYLTFVDTTKYTATHQSRANN